MLFHSRVRYYFVYIAIILFIFLILPFCLIKLLLWTLIVILFLSNIWLTPYILSNYKKYFFGTKWLIDKFISLKLYSKNINLWKINYYHTFLLVIIFTIISFLNENKYISLMSGLFTGAIISAIFSNFYFSYEKHLFYHLMSELYEKNIYLLGHIYENLSKLKSFSVDKLESSEAQEIAKKLQVSERSLNLNISQTKLEVGRYDDPSYMSFNAYYCIVNLNSISNKYKKLLLNIVGSSINVNLIACLNETKKLCIDIDDSNIELLKILIDINSIILDIKNYDIKLINNYFDKELISTKLTNLFDKINELSSKFLTYKNSLTNIFTNFKNYY